MYMIEIRSRRVGKTTRLVDYVIQELFTSEHNRVLVPFSSVGEEDLRGWGDYVDVAVDPDFYRQDGTGRANISKELIQRIKNRLLNEHNKELKVVTRFPYYELSINVPKI